MHPSLDTEPGLFLRTAPRRIGDTRGPAQRPIPGQFGLGFPQATRAPDSWFSAEVWGALEDVIRPIELPPRQLSARNAGAKAK